MAKSDYLESGYLTHVLRTGSLSKPSGIYVALFTSATSDNGSGTEVSGGSYARVQHGPSDATWSAIGSIGQTQNIGEIQYADPTANWGTVTHFALMDAASGGDMLYHGPLAASKVINSGDGGPKFSDGSLIVTES